MAAKGASQQQEASFSGVLARALVRDGRWDRQTFEHFPLVVYWLRQLLGLAVGLLCGLAPLTGAAGFVLFGVVNALVPHLYATKYANVDTEDFTPVSLLSEGFQPSFGVFLLTWIIAFTFRTGA